MIRAHRGAQKLKSCVQRVCFCPFFEPANTTLYTHNPASRYCPDHTTYTQNGPSSPDPLQYASSRRETHGPHRFFFRTAVCSAHVIRKSCSVLCVRQNKTSKHTIVPKNCPSRHKETLHVTAIIYPVPLCTFRCCTYLYTVPGRPSSPVPHPVHIHQIRQWVLLKKFRVLNLPAQLVKEPRSVVCERGA